MAYNFNDIRKLNSMVEGEHYTRLLCDTLNRKLYPLVKGLDYFGFLKDLLDASNKAYSVFEPTSENSIGFASACIDYPYFDIITKKIEESRNLELVYKQVYNKVGEKLYTGDHIMFSSIINAIALLPDELYNVMVEYFGHVYENRPDIADNVYFISGCHEVDDYKYNSHIVYYTGLPKFIKTLFHLFVKSYDPSLSNIKLCLPWSGVSLMLPSTDNATEYDNELRLSQKSCLEFLKWAAGSDGMTYTTHINISPTMTYTLFHTIFGTGPEANGFLYQHTTVFSVAKYILDVLIKR